MKFKINKSKVTNLVIIMIVVLSFNSCDLLIRSNEGDKAKVSLIEKSVSMDKNEAKLLVKASQDNLDVIELCKIIEEEKVDDKVKNLVEEIKHEQLQILEKYNTIALNNVISIPQHSDIQQEVDATLKKKEHIKVHLKLLSNKINNQIELLQRLSGTTNNSEFKALAHFANHTLKSNLTKTKYTLNTLKKES